MWRVTFLQSGVRMTFEDSLASEAEATSRAAWVTANGYYFDANGQSQAPADVLTEAY